MTSTLVDIDDGLLAEAGELLGTSTKKATVNAALAEVIAAARRRAYVDALAERRWPDYGDPDVRAEAWR